MARCTASLTPYLTPCLTPSHTPQVCRPSNYVASDALLLGPVVPDPTLSTAHLEMCKTVVEDSWNKVFIGGLPCSYGEDQVRVCDNR